MGSFPGGDGRHAPSPYADSLIIMAGVDFKSSVEFQKTILSKILVKRAAALSTPSYPTTHTKYMELFLYSNHCFSGDIRLQYIAVAFYWRKGCCVWS